MAPDDIPKLAMATHGITLSTDGPGVRFTVMRFRG
jgi:hypothetical protein